MSVEALVLGPYGLCLVEQFQCAREKLRLQEVLRRDEQAYTDVLS